MADAPEAEAVARLLAAPTDSARAELAVAVLGGAQCADAAHFEMVAAAAADAPDPKAFLALLAVPSGTPGAEQLLGAAVRLLLSSASVALGSTTHADASVAAAAAAEVLGYDAAAAFADATLQGIFGSGAALVNPNVVAAAAELAAMASSKRGKRATAACAAASPRPATSSTADTEGTADAAAVAGVDVGVVLQWLGPTVARVPDGSRAALPGPATAQGDTVSGAGETFLLAHWCAAVVFGVDDGACTCWHRRYTAQDRCGGRWPLCAPAAPPGAFPVHALPSANA